jgi:hypothetical protein
MAYFTGSEFLHKRHLPADLDLPKGIDPTFFDELARSVGVMPPAGDSEAADDEAEEEDGDEAASQSQLTAEAERRLRMAMVLAVCVLGPANRYDGLRQPAPEDFFVRRTRRTQATPFSLSLSLSFPSLTAGGGAAAAGRTQADGVVAQRPGRGGLCTLPLHLDGRTDLRLLLKEEES